MTLVAELNERIDKCQKILEIDPNSQIFAALAEAFRKKGDLDKAFRVCQNGLRIHPSYGSAHAVMAKINMDRGLYDWAEAEIRKAIELDGNSRSIELLLAEIHIYKGEFNAAVKLLRKLSLSDPNNEQIKKLLEIALKLPKEQIAQNHSALSVRPAQQVVEAPRTKSQAYADAIPAASGGLLSASEVIKRALQTPDIEGALVFNSEGLVVESEWNVSMDSITCAATMAEVGKFLDQELVKVSFGKIRTLLIETQSVFFYLLQAREGIFLFVCNPKINLGTLRMKITALMDQYRTI